jgi:hypothetical protein
VGDARPFVVLPAARSVGAWPAAPLGGIRQHEQVQAGEQEQGEREQRQEAHPDGIPACTHGYDVDDDGHRFKPTTLARCKVLVFMVGSASIVGALFCDPLDSRLLRRPVGRINAELHCVLGVQSLPAAELHGLDADDASNRLTGEKAIQHIEADVPAGSTH